MKLTSTSTGPSPLQVVRQQGFIVFVGGVVQTSMLRSVTCLPNGLLGLAGEINQTGRSSLHLVVDSLFAVRANSPRVFNNSSTSSERRWVSNIAVSNANGIAMSAGVIDPLSGTDDVQLAVWAAYPFLLTDVSQCGPATVTTALPLGTADTVELNTDTLLIENLVVTSYNPGLVPLIPDCTESEFWKNSSDIYEAVETLGSNGIELWPNPTCNSLNVRVGGLPASTIQIVNVNGQVVAHGSQGTVDVSRLPVGIYLVQATGRDGNVQSSRVMVEH